jgi:hypothetical protein
LLLLAGTTALAATSSQFAQAISWTEPGFAYQSLSTQPLACLNGGPVKLSDFQAGRALFNTPTLLGGQAAKAGLSCASCHVNGRNNPHFLLPQVSGQPGTADVTNSFFSAARGNGRFDPVAIPDLANPGKISRDPGSKALEGFIRNLIVEEFAGAEPTPEMLGALAGYVRLLEPCAVAKPGGEQPVMPQSLSLQIGLINDALDGALAMSDRSDNKAAKLLVAAARHQLGLIDERFPSARFPREHVALLTASSALVNATDSGDLGQALKQWRQDFQNRTLPALTNKQRQSLYDPKPLAKALGVGLNP